MSIGKFSGFSELLSLLVLSSLLPGPGWATSDGSFSFSQTSFSGSNVFHHQRLSLSSARPETCPAALEPLVAQMVRDLPSYANRANTRYGIPNNYVLIAGRPEFEPLPLGPGEPPTRPEKSGKNNDPYQVFITTLIRSYQNHQLVSLQEYHWLFLTRSNSGWRLAMMYSMIGPYPGGSPPSPPRDSSNGSLAQAIQTWLNDCRTGSLPPQVELKKAPLVQPQR